MVQTEYRWLGQEDVSDFDALIALFQNVFEHESSPRTDGKQLQTLLSQPHFRCIAAFEFERVIGGLTLHRIDSYYSPQPQVYLYDLAVHPDHQRKGIGRNLVAEGLKWTRSIGASELYVQAHVEDAEALAFYRSLNGVDESGVVHFSFVCESLPSV